jgi:hypothetical protein
MVAKPLTPPGGARSAICRIAVSSKATFKFEDVPATKFLMHPLFMKINSNDGNLCGDIRVLN